MHELPAIKGKIIETVETIDFDGNIEEVRIFFTDGSTLVCTSSFCANGLEGYVNLRLEPPAGGAVISSQTKWPGE